MIATAIVYGAIALTGFGCGWWCASYLGTWRLQKFHAEVQLKALMAYGRNPTAEVWNEAALDTIRKCMEKTP